jgi:hypothetical protein
LDAINDPNSPLLYNIEELIFRLDSNDLMFGGRAALRKANAQMLLMISIELKNRGVSLAELITLAQKYSETDLERALQEINARN